MWWKKQTKANEISRREGGEYEKNVNKANESHLIIDTQWWKLLIGQKEEMVIFEKSIAIFLSKSIWLWGGNVDENVKKDQ